MLNLNQLFGQGVVEPILPSFWLGKSLGHKCTHTATTEVLGCELGQGAGSGAVLSQHPLNTHWRLVVRPSSQKPFSFLCNYSPFPYSFQAWLISKTFPHFCYLLPWLTLVCSAPTFYVSLRSETWGAKNLATEVGSFVLLTAPHTSCREGSWMIWRYLLVGASNVIFKKEEKIKCKKKHHFQKCWSFMTNLTKRTEICDPSERENPLQRST